jgi:signal transduction histidine kinase
MGVTILVIAGRLALDPWWGRQNNRHLVFLPTVMLAAWIGGLGPGLVATALSTVALAFLWADSTQSPMHGEASLILYLLLGVAISLFIEWLHRARAAAESSRASLQQVLAVVAHDLRNPLSVIKMTSSSLSREHNDNDSDVRKLRSLDRAVERMESLIRDLVYTTRIDHGELTMARHPENCGSIVREVVDMFAPLGREKGVLIEADIDDAGAMVECDRDRVLQVLVNLVGNALKFTPNGGRITLRVAKEGASVRFMVTDTGTGISPEHIPHVFERYWKADPHGTGLGLFIAQSIVEAHGGHIEVRSEPGSGASFSFALPLMDEAKSSAHFGAPEPFAR